MSGAADPPRAPCPVLVPVDADDRIFYPHGADVVPPPQTIGMRAPNPHPLDYDWRFEAQTAVALSRRAAGASLLAVGTPSLVQVLGREGRNVQLVDHQPHLASLGAVLIDVETAGRLDGQWMIAVLDPPWYPVAYRRWLGWAAQHVPLGGRILASLWPNDTRPAAQVEREELLAWISEWADHRIVLDALRYEVPAFESVARRAQGIAEPEAPWRSGDLIELFVRRVPLLPPALDKNEVWRRFVWDDYQLALRVGDDSAGAATIAMHPLAHGWIWPSYSRRAPGRECIDLWSSRNEVAVVMGGPELERELLQLTGARRIAEKAILGEALEMLLNTWDVPAQPFRRSYSWTHRASH